MVAGNNLHLEVVGHTDCSLADNVDVEQKDSADNLVEDELGYYCEVSH